ncbi:CU044_5270 family protein [Streptomyces niveus]|uniref:CU044_5270 family protein n=1 Tax=Streptomyces niveus TaxID=193462 RepID=UPI0036C4F29C
MDEMPLVRDLRADAPVPDRARLAPGRRRLLDAATSGGLMSRLRGLRSDWRTAAVGAVAAMTAAALSATLLVGGGDPATEASLLSGRAPAGSAAEVLRTAALMVGDDPVPTPRADQWIYVREGYYSMVREEKPAGLVAQPDVNYHPLGEKKYLVPQADGLPRAEAEEWIPYADPDAERGRTDQKYSAREIFRFLADLPDDPQAILDEVRAFYPANPPENPETPDEHAFRALGLLAVQQPVPHPQGLAKIYRTLATIPGIQVSRATDQFGRETVAISRAESGDPAGHVREYLLNPSTGLPVGQRWAVEGDGTYVEGGDGGRTPAGDRPATNWKKGDVLVERVRFEGALVDKDHERP